MKNVDFEIFVSGTDDKVDIAFSDGREWGVYYDPTESYEWVERNCERCGKKKGGYDRNISIEITEVMDSNKMVPIKRYLDIPKAEIERFLVSDDEFVCCDCLEEELEKISTPPRP